MKHIKKQPSFIVEGNIGAGKSTFLSIVKKYLDMDIIYEPHEQWQNVGGEHNLLELFYSDTKRWAYTFQTFAFVSRTVAQEKARSVADKPLLFERSVYSDRFCFAKNCHEMGTITDLEFALYKEWFSWLIDTHVTPPTGFIYLRATPEKCYERILKRQRSEENNIPFDYVVKLFEKHEDWLIHKKDLNEKLAKVPVLVIDCEKEFENDIDIQNEMIDKIKKKFGVESKINMFKNGLLQNQI